MPWKEVTKVEEREEMVRKYASRMYGKSELARQYGVSRPTLDLWIGRGETGEGLEDRSSRPEQSPHQTEPEIVERLIQAKREKPRWGPAKQRERLMRLHPEIAWPAASTIGGIYKGAGLIQGRSRTRNIEMRRIQPIPAEQSGQMMTCDHKGWFRLGNRQYCYPLTICDPVSRYIYAIDGLSSTSLEQAKPVFERVMREYGVPMWMLSDNGGPFCSSRSLAGLSRLSVWWIKLGIVPVRIRKGAPWENGIHERMHKTLKAETTKPPSGDHTKQQHRFNGFMREFNDERPHEGLNGETPTSQLLRSPRPYRDPGKDMDYPGHFEVRNVRKNGEIKFRGRTVFLSESLQGEQVGLEEVDDGIWTLRFSTIELARYDLRHGTLA